MVYFSLAVTLESLYRYQNNILYKKTRKKSANSHSPFNITMFIDAIKNNIAE